MAFTSEQIRNAQRVLAVGRRNKAPWKVQLAALETILVESGARNLNYGDRDSLGLFQQRTSQGWGTRAQVTNPEHAAQSFYTRAIAQQGNYRRAGGLAQAVQRSAFPSRYNEQKPNARALFRAAKGVVGPSAIAATGAGGVEPAAPDDTGISRLIQQSNQRLGITNRALDTRLAAPTRAPQQTQKPSVVSRETPTKGAPGVKSIVDIGHLAQTFGLHVGENPEFGGVHPVHADNSWHYKNRAIDVSGDPKKMAAFAAYVARNYGGSLKELFWRGKGARNIKNGKPVGTNFVSGHTDHVHVAF